MIDVLRNLTEKNLHGGYRSQCNFLLDHVRAPIPVYLEQGLVVSWSL